MYAALWMLNGIENRRGNKYRRELARKRLKKWEKYFDCNRLGLNMGLPNIRNTYICIWSYLRECLCNQQHHFLRREGWMNGKKESLWSGMFNLIMFFPFLSQFAKQVRFAVSWIYFCLPFIPYLFLSLSLLRYRFYLFAIEYFKTFLISPFVLNKMWLFFVFFFGFDVSFSLNLCKPILLTE